MKKFSRFLEDQQVQNIKNCIFFQKELKPRVLKGEMFAAIRENTIDFYAHGSRAFHWKNGHYKSSMNPQGKEQSFNIESSSWNIDIILQECKKKAKSEALQISKLFPAYSFLCNERKKSNIILVDIESWLDSKEKNKKDKIDLVFMLPSNNLIFVEAKKRNDSRMMSESSEKVPEVFKQIFSYTQHTGDENRVSEIITAYSKVSALMSEIFEVDPFPQPEGVVKNVPILIFEEKWKRPTDPSVDSRDLWIVPKLVEQISDRNRKVFSYLKRYHWPSDIHVIDGRDAFYDPNKLYELGDLLEEVSGKIAEIEKEKHS